jgi:hypothetical protein
MSVLRSIEHRIESIVEGVFGRAFRSHVQPVELARKLAKEMDDHKTVSVSRIYVPNEYHVYLAPSDREQFGNYEESLITELSDYLGEHARREGYAMLTEPRVVVEEDADLSVGEFGIATRMVQPRRVAPAPAPVPDGDANAPQAPERPSPPSPPPIPAAVSPVPSAPEHTEVVAAEDAERLGLARTPAALAYAGGRYELANRVVTIGRSHECDIAISDPNISRRHCEVLQEEGGYVIVDLGSTNGVEVNGARVQRARLEPEDRIVLGATELTFERGV